MTENESQHFERAKNGDVTDEPHRGRTAVLVEDSALRRLSAKDPLKKYVADLIRRRHFIAAEARSRAFRPKKDLFLGRVWLLLQPVMQVAMYGFLFGFILRTSRGIENFIGFLTIGVIFFGFMSAGLMSGSGLIRKSRNLISSFKFPKASLVLSSSVGRLFDALVPAVVAIVAALLFQLGEPLSWTIVLVVPLFALIHVFAAGLTFITARLTAFIPDTQPLLTFVNRAWFYVSGVFFSIERFATVPEIQSVMVANPAYQFLQAIRACVLYGQVPDPSTWLILVCWSFGTLIVGFLYFWRGEVRYASLR